MYDYDVCTDTDTYQYKLHQTIICSATTGRGKWCHRPFLGNARWASFLKSRALTLWNAC